MVVEGAERLMLRTPDSPIGRASAPSRFDAMAASTKVVCKVVREGAQYCPRLGVLLESTSMSQSKTEPESIWTCAREAARQTRAVGSRA